MSSEVLLMVLSEMTGEPGFVKQVVTWLQEEGGVSPLLPERLLFGGWMAVKRAPAEEGKESHALCLP